MKCQSEQLNYLFNNSIRDVSDSYPLCGHKNSWGWGEGRSRGGVAARRRAGVFPGMLWFR